MSGIGLDEETRLGLRSAGTNIDRHAGWMTTASSVPPGALVHLQRLIEAGSTSSTRRHAGLGLHDGQFLLLRLRFQNISVPRRGQPQLTEDMSRRYVCFK